MNRLIGIILLFCASASQAEFNTLELLTQDQFDELSENVAAATQYKGITPTEPLGIIGFDVGLSVSYTSIEIDEIFDLASAGDFDVAGIALPRLSIHKGLPFGLDVGASISAAPGTDIQVLGAEVRYAILEGNVAIPAVGVRASYSTVSGVDEIDLDTLGLDISVSKGFLLLTPYAGVGILRTTATPNGAPNLEEETFSQSKVFAGLNVSLGLLNLTFEGDRTGDHTTGSLKAGFRF